MIIIMENDRLKRIIKINNYIYRMLQAKKRPISPFFKDQTWGLHLQLGDFNGKWFWDVLFG